jgi:phage shock protein PspC (stress-responsive transcriptional regulator)
MSSQPLYRSKTDRKIAGVLGGIAAKYGWKSRTVRVVYVVLSLISAAFPGLLVYVVLWVVVPEEE